jgi:hypothetical protein
MFGLMALMGVLVIAVSPIGASATAQLTKMLIADPVNNNQVAKVDANGRLQVGVGNFPTPVPTQAVSGTVNVGNFPNPVATQEVSGSVSVDNLPDPVATQEVTGTVNVGNFPTPQATQAVTGIVGVDPNQNSVTSGDTTEQIASGQYVYSSCPGTCTSPFLGPVDVSGYRGIRVDAHTSNSCFNGSVLDIYDAEDALLGSAPFVADVANGHGVASVAIDDVLATSAKVVFVDNGCVGTWTYTVYGRTG